MAVFTKSRISLRRHSGEQSYKSLYNYRATKEVTVRIKPENTGATAPWEGNWKLIEPRMPTTKLGSMSF
jgi:hypothetical protein